MRAYNRKANVPSCDGLKVCLCDPCIPVASERLFRRFSVLQLSKRPFIDDSRVPGIIKYVWCDPGLLRVNQQRASIDVAVWCLLREGAIRQGSHRGPLLTHTGSLG